MPALSQGTIKMADAWPDLARFDRRPTLLVTTVGRKTGRPHAVKIWFAASSGGGGKGRIYLTSGRGPRADWVKNLRENPEVSLSCGALTLRGRAAWLEGAEVRERVLPLFFRKYLLARLFHFFGWYTQSFAFEIEPLACE